MENNCEVELFIVCSGYCNLDVLGCNTLNS